MNDKDTQILKDSALVVADGIVATMPPLAIAWGLGKALYGSGMKLRQQRALEWVELVRDNPDVFTEQLLKQEEFQDGFVYTLEKYIRERNEEKRSIIKNIFLGYAGSSDQEEFEIERMINILSSISFDGIKLLAILKPLSVQTKSEMLSELLSKYLVADSNDNQDKYSSYKNVRDMWADAETDLISVGLLRTYNIARYGGENYVSHYDYDLSRLGKQFIEYIQS